MIYLSLLLISLDQFLKHLANTFVEPIWLIDDKLGIELTFNTGSAFSLPIPQEFTIPLALIVSGLLIYWYYHHCTQRLVSLLTCSLIVAGSMGNTIDRFFYGQVTDFIKIYSWPNFNLADVYLSIGALLLIVFLDSIRLEHS